MFDSRISRTTREFIFKAFEFMAHQNCASQWRITIAFQNGASELRFEVAHQNCATIRGIRDCLFRYKFRDRSVISFLNHSHMTSCNIISVELSRILKSIHTQYRFFQKLAFSRNKRLAFFLSNINIREMRSTFPLDFVKNAAIFDARILRSRFASLFPRRLNLPRIFCLIVTRR